MGSEAFCRLRYGDRVVEGKALLETAEVIFRSPDLRLRIPFRDMTSVSARDGELRIEFGSETAWFEIGRDAVRWAEKILKPRGLLDKLGVKQGQRVGVLGLKDESFLRQLAARALLVTGEGAEPVEVLFYAAATRDELARLPELRRAIRPDGAI